MDYYRRQVHRVAKLVHTDGDGAPDKAANFSNDMRERLDRTGVLWLEGSLLNTGIPHLWRFTDTRSTSVAHVRERVSSGFGVRVALCGHVMHGLVQRTAGRIFWSIGDRDYHVSTKKGALLARPFTVLVNGRAARAAVHEHRGTACC